MKNPGPQSHRLHRRCNRPLGRATESYGDLMLKRGDALQQWRGWHLFQRAHLLDAIASLRAAPTPTLP